MKFLNSLFKMSPAAIIVSLLVVGGLIGGIVNAVNSATVKPTPAPTTTVLPVPTESVTPSPTDSPSASQTESPVVKMQDQTQYSTKDVISAAGVIEKAADAVCLYSADEKDAARIARLKKYFASDLSVVQPNAVLPLYAWRECKMSAAYALGVVDRKLIMYARLEEYSSAVDQASKPKDEQVTKVQTIEVVYHMVKSNGSWKVVFIEHG